MGNHCGNDLWDLWILFVVGLLVFIISISRYVTFSQEMKYIRDALLPVLMSCATSAGNVKTLEELLNQVSYWRCYMVRIFSQQRAHSLASWRSHDNYQWNCFPPKVAEWTTLHKLWRQRCADRAFKCVNSGQRLQIHAFLVKTMNIFDRISAEYRLRRVYERALVWAAPRFTWMFRIHRVPTCASILHRVTQTRVAFCCAF